MIKTTFTAASLLLAASSAHAFTITSPSSSEYWVSCANNTLRWTSNSTDAEQFSVALIDQSNAPNTPSLVNGNLQIANSLETSAGSAIIELNCVTAGSTYQLLFVNASQYELLHPQVFFTGDSFEIKPNGTAPASSDANGNGNDNGNGSTGTGTGTGSTGMSTSVLSGASPTGSASASPSSASSKTGAAPASLRMGGSIAGALLAAVAAGVCLLA
ncbi:hypothetical protein OC834_006540 [Tilletia horrida]|uniref:Yeast cell wall synthesis Kre9/Knh1-like N-terminal domain-containing protein n=1 Tax=Tilletia horrida TaxID=155126 RepID=A0AAN6JHV6_9BASI|nr:hypothetical protein OC834_006540 [Tilletia horrida]KAK0522184.1 hypothetical protein OC842_006543 [Tilletia horrida]